MSIFLFISCMLVPLVMCLFRARLRRDPPKNVNWLYGYRTSRSMRSPQAWDYANRRCGEVWSRLGPIAGAVSALAAILAWRRLDKASLWIVGFQLLALFMTVPVVERDLKERFDSEGQPRRN